MGVTSVSRTNGAISYWREGNEEFTVTRNASGLPVSVQSTMGRWPSQECEFFYDVSGNFIGMSNDISTGMLETLLAEANRVAKLVTSNGNTVLVGADGLNLLVGKDDTAPLTRPHRIGTYGDSRSVATATTTLLAIKGSGNYLSQTRIPTWIAGVLGDAEIVCNFGYSGDLATAWASASRPNGKTINNLIAANLFSGGKVDAVYVQYGINDYNAGASAATVTAAIKALCSQLMSSGIKVILEECYPTTAAAMAGGIGAPAKLQNILDGNAILKTWAAAYPYSCVFVETRASLVDATGYLSATYTADGTHCNALGAKLSGTMCAIAARAILPRKPANCFTSGPLNNPNLIDWGAMASGTTLFSSGDAGTFTHGTPTTGVDTATGMPYAEFTTTCLTLGGSAHALARFEVHAQVSGTPRFPLFVGDELQGSAYVTVDDGAGGVPPVQAVSMRMRLYSDSKFADDCAFEGSAVANYGTPLARRYTTPTFVTATASAGISAAAVGAGLPLQVYVQFNEVGKTARVRVYAPTIRVVSQGGIQPSQPAAGASPYTYTNTTGTPVMLYVAGGTVSAIAVSRQGTAFTTGFIEGAFRLAQNDSVVITYTVAPTLTVVPE